ncbi:MAG: hypothetical protein R2788_26320 [Saprospiraceae bacterium]
MDGGDFGLQKISIRKNPFKNYLKNEKGELNAIRGILADRESIFLNVEHLGPTIIDRATGNAQPIEFASKGFGNNALQKLKDGRIAFGHSRFLGLTDLSGKPPEFFPVGFYTWAIFQASENTVWLGTEAGLQIFDPTRNEVRPSKNTTPSMTCAAPILCTSLPAGTGVFASVPTKVFSPIGKRHYRPVLQNQKGRI